MVLLNVIPFKTDNAWPAGLLTIFDHGRAKHSTFENRYYDKLLNYWGSPFTSLLKALRQAIVVTPSTPLFPLSCSTATANPYSSLRLRMTVGLRRLNYVIVQTNRCVIGTV